jgi:hypothetical protein
MFGSPAYLAVRVGSFTKGQAVVGQLVCNGQIYAGWGSKSTAPAGASEFLDHFWGALAAWESREGTFSSLGTKLLSAGCPSFRTPIGKKVRHDLICRHEDSSPVLHRLCMLPQFVL